MKYPAVKWLWVPPGRRIIFCLRERFSEHQTEVIHHNLGRFDYDMRMSTLGGYRLTFWQPLSDRELTTLMLLLNDTITDILYPENANEPENP